MGTVGLVLHRLGKGSAIGCGAGRLPLHALLGDLAIELGIGREGYVLLLHRRVDDNRALPRLLAVKAYRFGENSLEALFADATAKPAQGRRVDRKAPLELDLAGEVLEVRILHPLGDHLVVAEVVKLLEYQQPDHQANRLARSSLALAVALAHLPLESFPVDSSRELAKRLALVEQAFQVRQKEAFLVVFFARLYHLFDRVFRLYPKTLSKQASKGKF